MKKRSIVLLSISIITIILGSFFVSHGSTRMNRLRHFAEFQIPESAEIEEYDEYEPFQGQGNVEAVLRFRDPEDFAESFRIAESSGKYLSIEKLIEETGAGFSDLKIRDTKVIRGLYLNPDIATNTLYSDRAVVLDSDRKLMKVTVFFH